MIIIAPTNISKITKLLMDGKVIALPTDTIFGLSCKFDHVKAIATIYHIKKRNIEKPLTVITKDWEQAKMVGIISESLIAKIKQKFLPGKVTIVVPINENIKNNSYWKTKTTIAIRVSESLLIKKITTIIGPIIATSCNISNKAIINNLEELSQLAVEYAVAGTAETDKPSVIYDAINQKIIRY